MFLLLTSLGQVHFGLACGNRKQAAREAVGKWDGGVGYFGLRSYMASLLCLASKLGDGGVGGWVHLNSTAKVCTLVMLFATMQQAPTWA